MIIRPMQPDEIDSVVILFNYYRDATGIEDDRYSEDRVLQTIRTYTINWNLFFNVAYEGQRPVGLVGGFVSEDPVEGTRGANIQFCYLVDSHEVDSVYVGDGELVWYFKDKTTKLNMHLINSLSSETAALKQQNQYQEKQNGA